LSDRLDRARGSGKEDRQGLDHVPGDLHRLWEVRRCLRCRRRADDVLRREGARTLPREDEPGVIPGSGSFFTFHEWCLAVDGNKGILKHTPMRVCWATAPTSTLDRGGCAPDGARAPALRPVAYRH